MKFDFMLLKKNSTVDVELSKNGDIVVKSFYMDNHKLFDISENPNDSCKLEYINRDNKDIFAMEVTGSVSQKYLDINDIKYKSTHGHVRVDNEILENLYNQWPRYIKTEKEMIDKAKTTGQKQKIGFYTIPCENDKEDCTLDIILSYALPNGSIENIQCHTW